MKINKTILGRGAAVVAMAGMMLTATPAFAAQISATMQPTITKNWTVASEAQYSANETFIFMVKYIGYDAKGTSFTGAVSKGGKPVAVDDIENVALTGLKGDGLTKTATTKFLGDYDFTQPGVYKFAVNEVAGTNANINYSTQFYDVAVNVQWKEGSLTEAEVQSVVFTTQKDGKKVTTATFDNTAKDNDTLTVSKTVAGTAANTADTFNYTLRVEGATGGYTVTKGSETTTLTAGTDYKFTLRHGESISVANLPVGATYTVTEDETDYVETNTVNGAASQDGHVATGTIAKNGNVVAYKNEKGFVPQTGITMNTLPFVGVGVVAAGGVATLVISRKRRAGEDF